MDSPHSGDGRAPYQLRELRDKIYPRQGPPRRSGGDAGSSAAARRRCEAPAQTAIRFHFLPNLAFWVSSSWLPRKKRARWSTWLALTVTSIRFAKLRTNPSREEGRRRRADPIRATLGQGSEFRPAPGSNHGPRRPPADSAGAAQAVPRRGGPRAAGGGLGQLGDWRAVRVV